MLVLVAEVVDAVVAVLVALADGKEEEDVVDVVEEEAEGEAVEVEMVGLDEEVREVCVAELVTLVKEVVIEEEELLRGGSLKEGDASIDCCFESGTGDELKGWNSLSSSSSSTSCSSSSPSSSSSGISFDTTEGVANSFSSFAREGGRRRLVDFTRSLRNSADIKGRSSSSVDESVVDVLPEDVEDVEDEEEPVDEAEVTEVVDEVDEAELLEGATGVVVALLGTYGV
jgi:hypothetical protein